MYPRARACVGSVDSIPALRTDTAVGYLPCFSSLHLAPLQAPSMSTVRHPPYSTVSRRASREEPIRRSEAPASLSFEVASYIRYYTHTKGSELAVAFYNARRLTLSIALTLMPCIPLPSVSYCPTHTQCRVQYRCSHRRVRSLPLCASLVFSQLYPPATPLVVRDKVVPHDLS